MDRDPPRRRSRARAVAISVAERRSAAIRTLFFTLSGFGALVEAVVLIRRFWAAYV